jgi:hypothetical protein
MTGYPGDCSPAPGSRGEPDIAALAYQVHVIVNGVLQSTGGTSLSTPIAAGLINMVGEATKYSGSYVNYIYPWAESARYHQYFNDIVRIGSPPNGCTNQGDASANYLGYCSTPGWDAVTGVGSLNAYNLAVGWTAGSKYISGNSYGAVSASVDLTVPSGWPQAGNNYTVFLGAYDNTGDYNEVGMTARYGYWGFYYARIAACNSVTNVIYDGLTLLPGTGYTFRMSIAAGGLQYEVDTLDTTNSLITYGVSDSSASYFYISSGTGTCGLGNQVLPHGFSTAEYVPNDYVNVFNTPIPTYNFEFSNIDWCLTPTLCYSALYTDFGSYYSDNAPRSGSASLPPKVISDDPNGGMAPGVVDIINQPFSLSGSVTFGSLLQITVGQAGGTVTGSVVNALGCGSQGPGCSVTLDGLNLPDGASVTFSPSSPQDVEYDYTATFQANQGTTCANYWVNITATSGSQVPSQWPNWMTEYSFWLQISGCPGHQDTTPPPPPPHGPGGGGGCVAWGTLIQTPNGSVPVQSLALGQTVLGYDIKTHRIIFEKLVSANSTSESSILVINHGLLRVTQTDQPIYMRNSTYLGWLKDPKDLNIGDEVFDVMTGNWIIVSAIHTLIQRTIVYDVVTNGLNNFVADGILLDMKTPCCGTP